MSFRSILQRFLPGRGPSIVQQADMKVTSSPTVRSIPQALRRTAEDPRVQQELALAAIPGGNAVSKVGRGIINIGRRAYGRLYAPQTYKALGSAVGSSAIAGGAYGLTKYAFTGNWRDLFTGPQAFAGLLGFRVAPLAGAFGATQGVKDVALDKIKDLVGLGTQTIPKFEFPDFSHFNFPSIPAMSYYGAPINLPSSSTSVSVMGGGSGDFGTQAILFALLAGGGAGFLFGRKKRRRKKYKHRKYRK